MSGFECQTDLCPPVCDDVFKSTHVSYLTRGGTRVYWNVGSFSEPMPWSFQLEYSPLPTSDWVAVGSPVENSFYAIDSTQRNYGQRGFGFYRVKLTTPVGTHYSKAFSSEGTLDHRSRRIAQELLRKEQLHNRLAGVDGYLLKRRQNAQPCSRCVDEQTNQATDPNCPQCHGTGQECGYYYPVGCVWANIGVSGSDVNVDDQGNLGTVGDIVTTARMLAVPWLDSFDVWVARKTDLRYFVRKVASAIEIRGVPIVLQVELRLIPQSDHIYKIAIPEQDAWLQTIGS